MSTADSEDIGPHRRSLLPVSSKNSAPDPHMGQVPPHIGQVQSLRVVGQGRNGPIAAVPQLPKGANWQYSRSHQGYLGHLRMANGQ